MCFRHPASVLAILLLATPIAVTDGESSASMKIRGVITTSYKKGNRLKITKEPFRPRDEPLLIRVNALLEYRRKPAEGADKNTTHHAKTDQTRALPLVRTCAEQWSMSALQPKTNLNIILNK
jgi:hypothetical protein